jgi:hypothetical protein
MIKQTHIVLSDPKNAMTIKNSKITDGKAAWKSNVVRGNYQERNEVEKRKQKQWTDK